MLLFVERFGGQMGNIDERVRRLVHLESCSLLLNTFQSAAAGTLKYRCGTNKRGGEQDLMDLASIKCQTRLILTASSFAAALSLLSPPGAQNVTMRFAGCRHFFNFHSAQSRIRIATKSNATHTTHCAHVKLMQQLSFDGAYQRHPEV